MAVQIHYSDIKLFLKCRRQWDWGSPIRQNLRARNTPKALWIGDGTHRAMEAFYTKHQDPVKVFSQWASRTAQNVSMSDEKMDDVMDTITGMLEHYKWWAERHDPIDKYEVVKAEMPMAVHLDPARLNGRTDVYYTLRVDGICSYRMPISRGLNIAEYKTMETLTDDNLTLVEQASLYLWAVKKIMEPKATVRGMVYTLLWKRKPPEPLKKGGFKIGAKIDLETVEHYKVKLSKETMAALRSIESPFVWRRFVTRNEFELQEIEERLYAIVNDMLDPNVRIYPNHDLVGCRLCAFRAACEAKNAGGRYQELLQTLNVPGGTDREYVPELQDGGRHGKR